MSASSQGSQTPLFDPFAIPKMRVDAVPQHQRDPRLGERVPNLPPRRMAGGSGASSRTAPRNAHSQPPRELTVGMLHSQTSNTKLKNYGVSTPAADAETPDTTVDETDGCLGNTGHRIIKAVLAGILEFFIDKRMQNSCDGCTVDHPSQTRHTCLFEPSAYYFYGCFEEISLKLLTPELKNILAQALSQYGGRPHLQRIQGAVEAILYDLKDEMYIVEQLSLIREKFIDESCEEINTAVDKWKRAVSEDPEITQV
ncbi:hypothetical protein PO909_016812 [Leuciscus waleckii]